MSDKVQVVVQKWEESELGWGTRPDGFSLHMTETDRSTFVSEYWKRQKEEFPTPPEEYSRPDGEPYLAEVDEEVAREIRASKIGIYKAGIPPNPQGTNVWRSANSNA